MDEPQKIWRVNRTPRFTALELGEYMASDDGPRETILKNLKYERIARTIIYKEINEAVARFVASPVRDHGILTTCHANLERERDATTHPQARENVVYALRALEAFQRALNSLELGGLQVSLAPIPRHPMIIEGVKVSVRPTASIRVVRSHGGFSAGALLIDLAKGLPLKTDEAQAKVRSGMEHCAIVLYRYVEESLVGDDAKASASHCIVFHSFRGQRIVAPTNHKRMMRNIEAVCRGAASAWDGIKPPSSFDPSKATYRA